MAWRADAWLIIALACSRMRPVLDTLTSEFACVNSYHPAILFDMREVGVPAKTPSGAVSFGITATP